MGTLGEHLHERSQWYQEMGEVHRAEILANQARELRALKEELRQRLGEQSQGDSDGMPNDPHYEG